MKLGKTIEFFVKHISNSIIFLFRVINYKKKRIFIYTDSRGFEITKIYNKKNPFSSYVYSFIRSYKCKVFVCPEKHTTVFDFLYAYYKENKTYDFVISHIGVVDFSPRPISDIRDILELKKKKITTVFNEEFYNSLINFKGYDTLYNNQRTSAILPESQIKIIAEKFNEIENLLWISCNPVLLNWKGNYRKLRPDNINLVNVKSKMLIEDLKTKKIIDLTNLTPSEVKEYTCDNIHLSEKGMEFIEEKMKELIS